MAMQGNNRKIELKKYQELVRETLKDLDGIMKVSLKDQMKELAESALGRSVRAKDPMFWPAGMLMLGLVEARERLAAILYEENDIPGKGIFVKEIGDIDIRDTDTAHLIKEIDAAIMRHVSLWKDGYKSKIDYIDDALAGSALLKLYMQKNHWGLSSSVKTDKSDDSGEKQISTEYSLLPSPELSELCKYTADKIYEYLMNAPRDPEGTIVYNPGRSAANVFADGVGQTSMFLSLYGKIFDKKEALDLAGTQLLNYKKFGCDERSGLIYHGYSLEKDNRVTKKGLLSWGRAAGWLIMGLSEYVKAIRKDIFETEPPLSTVKSIEKDLPKELAGWYMKLSDTLWSYQREDGCFSWQVQAVDGPLDTSATGMIIYGLANGESSEEISEEKITRAVSGMVGNISYGRVMNALSSCDDFGVHYQTYGHYPWGQGAVLAALSSNLV